MCLGELGLVVARDADRVVVRSNRGDLAATTLLAPGVAVGDHVVVHSGHVLSVIDADEAAAAAVLRTGTESTAIARPTSEGD